MKKGKTVFAQIMSLFNEYEFKKCVDRYARLSSLCQTPWGISTP